MAVEEKAELAAGGDGAGKQNLAGHDALTPVRGGGCYLTVKIPSGHKQSGNTANREGGNAFAYHTEADCMVS